MTTPKPEGTDKERERDLFVKHAEFYVAHADTPLMMLKDFQNALEDLRAQPQTPPACICKPFEANDPACPRHSIPVQTPVEREGRRLAAQHKKDYPDVDYEQQKKFAKEFIPIVSPQTPESEDAIEFFKKAMKADGHDPTNTIVTRTKAVQMIREALASHPPKAEEENVSMKRDAMMAAVEFGYKQCEKGHNIQKTLEMADLFIPAARSERK